MDQKIFFIILIIFLLTNNFSTIIKDMIRGCVYLLLVLALIKYINPSFQKKTKEHLNNIINSDQGIFTSGISVVASYLKKFIKSSLPKDSASLLNAYIVPSINTIRETVITQPNIQPSISQSSLQPAPVTQLLIQPTPSQSLLQPAPVTQLLIQSTPSQSSLQPTPVTQPNIQPTPSQSSLQPALVTQLLIQPSPSQSSLQPALVTQLLIQPTPESEESVGKLTEKKVTKKK
jgi:hypothetical protein